MIGLFKTLVCAALAVGALGSPRHTPKDEGGIINWDTFQALLDTIDPASLHSVLHSLSPKFQDGVFSKDRAAMEHVHSENPIIASKLVHIAKKRQDNSTTTSISSTSTNSDAASISSILSSEILASTVPAATTITVAPEAPASATAVATTDGAVVFSTVGGGLVTLTSEEVGVRFTPSTSTRLAFTTLPDGSVSTSTSVVVVNAPITDSADSTGAAGAATTGSGPGLQDAAVSVKTPGILVLLAGLAGWLLAQ